MTDLEKVRAEIERLKESNNQYLLACSTDVAIQAEAKEQAYDEILSFIDSLQSDKKDEKFIGLEELEEAANIYINTPRVKSEKDKIFNEISRSHKYTAFIAGAQWQRDRDRDVYFWKGMQYAKEQMMKEELMEWLEKELRDAIALENCSNDDADRGRISAYEKVIDKIKSL